MASSVECELQRMQKEYLKAMKQYYALKSKDLLIDNELCSWQMVGKQMTDEFHHIRTQLDALQGVNVAPEQFKTLAEFEDNYGMERFFASLKSTTNRKDSAGRGPNFVDLRQRSLALDQELQDLKRQLETVDAQCEGSTEEERICETLQEQLKQSNLELADLKQETERLKLLKETVNETQMPNPVLRKESFFNSNRSKNVKPKTVRFSFDSVCN